MRSKEKNMDLTSTENEAAKKSTLFSLMTKNLYPRKGNIFLKGKNIQNLNLKEFARKVAIVQQYNSASDDITVENLVAFGRTPHKKMMQGDSAEDERMIQWALEVTNLTEYRDREVSRLSGGQRQAIALLMSTMTPIDFLILDEHTAALDPKTAELIMKLTGKIVEEKKLTTIMVTHNLRYAVEYGNRLLMMHQGGVVMDLKGKEKEELQVEDILSKFNEISIECGN